MSYSCSPIGRITRECFSDSRLAEPCVLLAGLCGLAEGFRV